MLAGKKENAAVEIARKIAKSTKPHTEIIATIVKPIERIKVVYLKVLCYHKEE